MFPTKIFINYKEKSTVEKPGSHCLNYCQSKHCSQGTKQNHVSTKEMVTKDHFYETPVNNAKPGTSNGEISTKPKMGDVLQNN